MDVTPDLRKHRSQGAELLRMVVDGTIMAKDAINKWPPCKGDRILEVALHQLQHFEDDDDIRSNDDQYAKWQIGEMNKLIEDLIK